MEKEKKRNKIIYNTAKVILVTIFAFTIFLDSSLVFTKDLRALSNQIFFSTITKKNVLAFVLSWIFAFLLITVIEFVINKTEKNIIDDNSDIIDNEKEKSLENKKELKNKKIKTFFLIFGIILLLWSPYVLSYFPGGLFSDTLTSIRQCFHYISYDNANPIVYTMIIKFFLCIGKLVNNYQIGIDLFGITQVLFMAGVLAYFVCWLKEKHFSNIVLVLVTVFIGCFKLIPMYAISLWKDVPFSLVLFLYILKTIDIVSSNGNILHNKKDIIQYSILLFATSFLRNNGLYVTLAMTLIIILFYHKEKIKKFAIVSLVSFIAIFAIRGPIFTLIGLNSPSSGAATGSWNAIMVRQIFYTCVRDGNITDEQREIINKMCKIDTLKESYAPLLLDNTTVHPEFDSTYIATNSGEIRKLWLQLFKQNPSKYIESYLLSTLGYWDVNKQFHDAYVSNFMWPTTPTVFGVVQTDLIKKFTGVSIIDEIKITKLYSSALFLFMMFTSALFTIYKKNYKNLLMYLPALFTWGTIMLATPISFSMRYVYILVLMTPLDFLIPFMSRKQTKD